MEALSRHFLAETEENQENSQASQCPGRYTIKCTRRTCLPPACLLVFAELISSTLKMWAICSSETSVESRRTTRRHIPEDDTLHNHRCENLKSYIVISYCKSNDRIIGKCYTHALKLSTNFECVGPSSNLKMKVGGFPNR
jgi:hypothetical protein